MTIEARRRVGRMLSLGSVAVGILLCNGLVAISNRGPAVAAGAGPALRVAGAPKFQGQTGPCTCQDEKTLEYRIREASLLIKLYGQEAQRVGPNTMFTLAAYNAFTHGPAQAAIDAMRQATPGAPATYGGGTDPVSCASTFPPQATACLLEGLKAHEAHHATLCESVWGRQPAASRNPAGDYRGGKPLADAYKEEVDAYTIEQSFLQSALAALPDNCKPPGWYLYYEVTVRGGASKVRMAAGDWPQEITWSVEQMYSGTARLDQVGPLFTGLAAQMQNMTPQQLSSMTPQQMQQLVKGAQAGKGWSNKVLSNPMEVNIDDLFKTFQHSPGEGQSYEESTRTQTWKGQGPTKAQSVFTFEDNGDGTYNVNIPIQPLGQPGQVTVQESTMFNRTPYGYGGQPTHETKTSSPQPEAFTDLKMPTVQGLLVNGAVRHAKSLPLKRTLDVVQFDSGWMPASPLTQPYDSWPQAKDRLTVRVYYRLSKFEM